MWNSCLAPRKNTRTRPGCSSPGTRTSNRSILAVNEGRIYQYLVKPWQSGELESVVDKAFEHNRLLRERRKLTEDLKQANVELEAKVKDRTQELEEKNRLLEEMNQAKNLFLGIAAHDLRGPSGNIAALAELIMDDEMTMTRAERTEVLGLIRGQAHGMLNLLGHLLDISKIEAGKLDLLPEPTSLGTYVEEMRKRHRLLAERKKITLTTEVAADLPAASFDRERIGAGAGQPAFQRIQVFCRQYRGRPSGACGARRHRILRR